MPSGGEISIVFYSLFPPLSLLFYLCVFVNLHKCFAWRYVLKAIDLFLFCHWNFWVEKLQQRVCVRALARTHTYIYLSIWVESDILHAISYAIRTKFGSFELTSIHFHFWVGTFQQFNQNSTQHNIEQRTTQIAMTMEKERKKHTQRKTNKQQRNDVSQLFLNHLT